MADQTYTFQDSDVQPVIVTDPQGFMVSTIPPWYAATMAGAAKLQTYLQSQGITTTLNMDYPMQNWNTTYFKVPKVPWLDDGKGAHENAGGLIWNYKNLPYAMADRIVKGSFALDDTQAGQ